MMCVPNDGVERKMQLSHSKSIDRALAKDKQVLKNQVQLLLLGKPRAGKTTLVKQLRVKTGDGFTQEEVEVARTSLLDNLTEAMRGLLSARDDLGQDWGSQTAAEDAMTLCCWPLTRLLTERGWKGVTSLLVRLWQDESVQKAWAHCSTLSGKYAPSTTEMIHIYRTTGGVSDCIIKGEASFRLVEMGGRSLTTRKLLGYFDNVTAVIFVASCSDVERKTRHGVPTFGFQETGEFFSLVARDASLHKVPLILLITKLDLLMEKAKKIDLKTVLPQLKGDPNNEKDVQKGLVEAFRSKCGNARPFYHHFLTGTDQNSVQDVFAEMKRDIRDSLLRKLLPQ